MPLYSEHQFYRELYTNFMFTGKYMAEWIMYGEPSIDLWSLDIRRFIAMHNNKKYLEDRVKEVLGKC